MIVFITLEMLDVKAIITEIMYEDNKLLFG